MPPEADDAPEGEAPASPENGDLTTESSSGNIQDIVARALEAENGAPDDSQDGPEESGELSEDDDAADHDEDEPEQETQAEADEAPEQEKPAETPAVDAPPPEPSEVERLKDLVANSQETLNKLLEVHTKNLVTQQKPAAPPAPRVSDEAVILALFGGDEERWKSLPQVERVEATRVAKEYQAREARNALNPAARYDELRQRALEDVARTFEPVLQDYYQRRAQDAIRSAVGDLKDPSDRKRLAEIYQRTPGANGSEADQLEALKLAGQLLQLEKDKAEIAREKQRVDASKRQRDVVKQAARKQHSGGRRSAPPQSNERPRLQRGEDLADFARRLEQFEVSG